MAKLDPAIRHAITPPQFDGRKVHRGALIDRLHGEIGRKLVAIAAPAGYGKTTLLADFIAHTDVPTCWVQVVDADRDFVRLAGVILASLEARFRRLRNQIDVRAYVKAGPRGLAREIAAVIDELVPEPFAICLDDVHAIHGADNAMEFLDELIAEMPEHVTFFASGREVVEVSLASMMARGQLAGFGPHDISLTKEEVSSLMERLTGEQLGTNELDRLYEETRGWATGVVLSEFAPTRASLAHGLPENVVYEYLASVALNRQPEPIRQFMLKANILPIMTGETCDWLLETTGSAEVLSNLAARGLFTTARPDGAYEFHPMFRALLSESAIAADRSTHTRLQKRAAAYFRETSPEYSISLYLASGDRESASEVVRAVADTYFNKGRLDTLQTWLGEFPLDRHLVPALVYYNAIIKSEMGDFEGAIGLLDELASTVEPETKYGARGLVHMCRVLLDSQKWDEVEQAVIPAMNIVANTSDLGLEARYLRIKAKIEYEIYGRFDNALSLIDESIRKFREANEADAVSLALQDKAAIAGMSGQLGVARACTIEALEIAERNGSSLAKAYGHNNLAQAEYLSGRFDAAFQQFTVARDQARRAGSKALEGFIVQGLAEVFSDLGLVYQSAALFSEGLEIAAEIDDQALVAWGCLGTSILHLRGGGHKLASEWIRRAIETNAGMYKPAIAIQKAAIFLQSDPTMAYRELKALLDDNNGLSADLEARARFYMVLALHIMGEDNQKEGAFRSLLELCSLRSSIQHLAVELFHQPTLLAWAENDATKDPTLSLVLERVQAIRDTNKRVMGSKIEELSSGGLEVQTLGETSVRWNRQNVSELKPQANELLLYLVDNGPTERDRLADKFWPEHLPGRQTANLHMAIYSIRRATAKDAIALSSGNYSVADDLEVRYDVATFERAAALVYSMPLGDPRRLFALTEALNLYRGQFMPEFFSDWIVERRRSLELKYLDLASAHADEALRRDQPSRAADALREALIVDPLRDDLNERYLRALTRLDRRSEALSHYSRYADLLMQELGLEPTEEIRAIHRELSVG